MSQGNNNGGGEDNRQSERQGRRTEPTRTEWIVGVASAALIAALLGFVVYEAIGDSDFPPSVVVRVDRVLETPTGYIVQVIAYNRGGTTAAAVEIEGVLLEGRDVVETSRATLSFVPAESEREGGLFFTRDPRRYTLHLRPQGYDRP